MNEVVEIIANMGFPMAAAIAIWKASQKDKDRLYDIIDTFGDKLDKFDDTLKKIDGRLEHLEQGVHVHGESEEMY